MKVTNERARQMLEALVPMLDMDGVVGYAAAYDSRMLNDACQEYSRLRDKALERHGEPVLDDDGNETGRYFLSMDSGGYDAFMGEIEPLMNIEHKVSLVTVTPKEAQAAGITGRQMLDADFMIDWADREGDDAAV